MMLTINEDLILRKDDHKLLTSYLNGVKPKTAFDRRNAVVLKAELKRAKVVEKEDFPNDAIRINSTVRVKTEGTDDIMEITIVTPEKANIREGKISVMAPIGTALIGFRQGQQVSWQMPSGKKTYLILDVINEQ
ncbi:GreA/GreB family elongation factor [Longitalea luteola]|uniref:GreA/GreB family elongation factor n=1 Tax=Longitalea luteola TaxID=2812563 RepID=UPI001A972C14|nr:GreA/GreB family elongation factor [Longitalea luteola]